MEQKIQEVDLGSTYLYEEDRPENSFKVFFNTASEEVAGLCITRTNPNVMKKKYPGYHKNIKMIWLTDIETEEISVDPSEVERISELISDFIKDSIKNNVESIIILDGLEYIISRNSFNQTLQLVHHLKDIISMYNTLLIIPLSPNAVELMELKQLERELEIVKF